MDQDSGHLAFQIENIGGIEACEIDIPPGVTILSGANATNRTSLLTAIAGVLGGSEAQLKSDAEEGQVTLDTNEERYTRTYERTPQGTTVTGNPYTDREELVNLFVCLLSENKVLQAGKRGEGLREVLMAPVDEDAIRERIDNLKAERSDLEGRMKEIERAESRRQTIAAERDEIEKKLGDVSSELERTREQLAVNSVAVDEDSEVDELTDRLESLQGDLQKTHDQIERQRDSLDALKEERATIERQLDDLSPDEESLDTVRDKLVGLEDDARELDDVIADLTTIIEVNEDLLSGGDLVRLDVTRNDHDVTAELDPGSATIECWTCGSRVRRDAIDSRIDRMQEIAEEKRAERREINERIENLQKRQEELQATIDECDQLEKNLTEVESEIDDREDRIADLEAEAESLREEIEDVKRTLESSDGPTSEEMIERHERLSNLEYERGRLDRELSEVESELTKIDRLIEERNQVASQLEEIEAELDEERSRIEDLERDVVGSFNERMSDIIDLLDYNNIERVWIERKISKQGRGQSDPGSTFALHVVRETDDGTVYEDDINTLSESERETIGLVVALSGYLTHEVYETVPVMLLDSLEPIDTARLQQLIEYFKDTVPYLIVALLQKDATTMAQEEYVTVISAESFSDFDTPLSLAN